MTNDEYSGRPMENWSDKTLLLVGCGNLGQAMLAGWLSNGVPAACIYILDPSVGDNVIQMGIPAKNAFREIPLGFKADIVVLAVKPDLVAVVASGLCSVLRGKSLVISVAAGVASDQLRSHFPTADAIIRAMPNLPAAIGRSCTTLYSEQSASVAHKQVAELLFNCVGTVHWMTDEDHMHAATAVAGSGPAYVFLVIEALAAAAEHAGLPPEVALNLARETIAGASEMALKSSARPAELRRQVSSPKGTTVAGLVPLLDTESGLYPLFRGTVAAAQRRSRALSSN